MPGDKTLTIKHQFILPAYLVNINDCQAAFCCRRNVRHPLRTLAVNKRRAVQGQHNINAGILVLRERVVYVVVVIGTLVVPKIFADRNANPLTTELKYAGAGTRLKISKLIKNIIERKQLLLVLANELSIGNHGRHIREGFSYPRISPDIANHNMKPGVPGRFVHHLLQHCQVPVDKVGVVEQVLAQIAGDG